MLDYRGACEGRDVLRSVSLILSVNMLYLYLTVYTWHTVHTYLIVCILDLCT